METRVGTGGNEAPMSDGTTQNDLEGVLSYMYSMEHLPAFDEMDELRWKALVGCDGERIGTIENIDRDEDTDRVEFMQVGRGGFLGFGAERFLVPVTSIVKVDEKHVYLDRPSQSLHGVPEYDYERVNDPDYCALVRAWWRPEDGSGGLSPEA